MATSFKSADTLSITVDSVTAQAITATIDCNSFIIDNLAGIDDIKFSWDSSFTTYFLIKQGERYPFDFPIPYPISKRFPINYIIGYMKTVSGTWTVSVILS